MASDTRLQVPSRLFFVLSRGRSDQDLGLPLFLLSNPPLSLLPVKSCSKSATPRPLARYQRLPTNNRRPCVPPRRKMRRANHQPTWSRLWLAIALQRRNKQENKPHAGPRASFEWPHACHWPPLQIIKRPFVMTDKHTAQLGRGGGIQLFPCRHPNN